jgi:hypothetical protein
VSGSPHGIADLDLVDPLREPSADADWDRQPADATRGLDPVAVAPVALGVLAVVEEDELVDQVDEVEVALPGDVAGLDDRDLFAADR